VRALLDTHTFLWFLGGSLRLSPQARRIIEDRENSVSVSTASLWEIAIKTSIGKLKLERPFAELIPEQLEKQQIGVLAIELAHLATVAKLPLHHRDPFDRLIIAQAMAERLPVLSVDEVFDAYPVQRVW
jgi:PIN domain nuclease of toxin-antitoxin system